MARLGKAQRAEKRRLLAIAEGLQKPDKCGRQSDGLVSSVGDYGRCALAGLKNRMDTPRARTGTWDYDGRHNKHGKAVSVEAIGNETERMDFARTQDARRTDERTRRDWKRGNPAKPGGVDVVAKVRPGVTPENIRDEAVMIRRVKDMTPTQRRALARRLANG